MQCKCLSLTIPWSGFVAVGAKRVETRGYKTSYRGPVAIHAATRLPLWARELWEQPPQTALMTRYGLVLDEMPRGVVICVVDLIAVESTEAAYRTLSDQEIALGDYSVGRAAWYLARPRPVVPPMPVRGMPWLFDLEVPDEAIGEVMADAEPAAARPWA